MQRILIFSDSLCLPRNNGDGQVLHYHDTWPSILATRHALSIARVNIGSATTTELLYQTRYWTAFQADYVVVQAGLCDALPRAMRPVEIELMKVMPANGLVKRYVSRYARALRRMRNIRLTSERQFALNVLEFVRLFPNLLWLSILARPVDPDHLPGTNSNITRYNTILQEALGEQWFDVRDLPDAGFMIDGFHLNASGHRFLVDRISQRLSLQPLDLSA